MHKYSFGNSSKSLTLFQGKSSVTPKRITYGCTQLLNANEFLEQVHSSSIPLLQIYVSFFFSFSFMWRADVNFAWSSISAVEVGKRNVVKVAGILS